MVAGHVLNPRPGLCALTTQGSSSHMGGKEFLAPLRHAVLCARNGSGNSHRTRASIIGPARLLLPRTLRTVPGHTGPREEPQWNKAEFLVTSVSPPASPLQTYQPEQAQRVYT